jgi:hypothetical protein
MWSRTGEVVINVAPHIPGATLDTVGAPADPLFGHCYREKK